MAKKRTNSKSQNGTPESKQVTPDSKNSASAETTEELQRDILDDFMFNAANYIYVRRKLFISLATGLVVILLAIYGGYRFLLYKDNVRNEKLFQIESVVNSQTMAHGAKYSKAKPLLDDFIDTYEGSDQHKIALLHRAEISYQNKQYEDAETDLATVMEIVNETSDFRVLAGIYLSNVLRDQEKADQAIDVLNSINGGKLGDIVLMELAETYLSVDRNEDARGMLQLILKDYPTSALATRATEMMNLL